MANSPSLTIVIPARNAAGSLGATITALGGSDAPEAEIVGDAMLRIVVADAASMDGTAARARELGAAVVEGPAGRGAQLGLGAASASSDWLLFLHADTRLEAGWHDAAAAHMAAPENLYRAAYFRFALDDTAPAARRLERIVAWRSRALGLPYGDQGLLISRALYDSIGGFRPLVLMEDVDIVRRIGRRRLAALDCRAVTSAARYHRSGYLLRPARNVFCLALYFLGLPQRLIARVYG